MWSSGLSREVFIYLFRFIGSHCRVSVCRCVCVFWHTRLSSLCIWEKRLQDTSFKFDFVSGNDHFRGGCEFNYVIPHLFCVLNGQRVHVDWWFSHANRHQEILVIVNGRLVICISNPDTLFRMGPIVSCDWSRFCGISGLCVAQVVV